MKLTVGMSSAPWIPRVNTRGTAIVAARYYEQQLSFQERYSRHLQSRHL
jgi:hypothetical protein